MTFFSNMPLTKVVVIVLIEFTVVAWAFEEVVVMIVGFVAVD